jgi:hypothetical protein
MPADRALDELVPSEIAELFHSLEMDVVNLHSLVHTFFYLYDDEERRKLLLKSAPVFFYPLEVIWLHHIILRLYCLLEGATTGKYENCSLELLLAKLSRPPLVTASDRLRTQLSSILLEARRLAAPLMTLRKKVIAHADYETVGKAGTHVPFAVKLGDIEALMHMLGKFLNTVTGFFPDAPEIHFYLTPNAGATQLVTLLLRIDTDDAFIS